MGGLIIIIVILESIIVAYRSGITIIEKSAYDDQYCEDSIYK